MNHNKGNERCNVSEGMLANIKCNVAKDGRERLDDLDSEHDRNFNVAMMDMNVGRFLINSDPLNLQGEFGAPKNNKLYLDTNFP